ncbi:MAG: hypothetical protein ACLTW9_29580 [Enterocloster sp.]
MAIDFDTPMTFYELLAVILAAIAIIIPIVQAIWKKWFKKQNLIIFQMVKQNFYSIKVVHICKLMVYMKQ